MAAACSGGPAPARATGSRIVLLYSAGDPTTDTATIEEFRLYIEAAVSPFPLEVSPAPVPALDPSVARAAAIQPDTLAVVWTSSDGSGLSYLVPALGDQVLSRRISDESTPARYEVMSAILLSELMPVLVDVFGQPPEQPALTELVLEEPEQPATDLDPIVPESESRIPFHLLISAAYLAVPLMPEHGYLSGAGLGLGVSIGNHLHVLVGLDLVQPAELGNQVGPAVFRRWPIRLGVAFVGPAGPVELGPSIGALVEIWRVTGLEYEPEDLAALDAHRNFGVAAAFRVRIRIAPWLGILVEAGTDLFFAVDRVMYQDGVLARRGQVQPRFAIGVMGEVGR